MSDTDKHGDLCECPACRAGEPMRPHLEYFVPAKSPSRLGTMCRAAARRVRRGLSQACLVARSDRVRRIREHGMPRWFDRRTAVITWVGLAALGSTPIILNSFDDGEPETIVRAEIRSIPTVRAFAPPAEADLQYRIDAAERPVVVQVDVGPALELCTTGYKELLRVAATASREILPVAGQHSNRMVVIHLRDTPLSFSSLAPSDRRPIVQRYGAGAATQYESSVALVLDTMVHQVQVAQPRAVLSVSGLPVEPEEAGVSIEIARKSNGQYATVIDRIDSFVPGRSFVVSGAGLDERRVARTRMQEALRLRDGRPVIFQTNAAWRALMDADGPDYADYHIAGSTEERLEIEASLSD